MTRLEGSAFRSPRYTARLTCQVVRERDFRLVADRVIDISARGILVGPADPVLTGERVFVSFDAGNGRWIDAEAVVARVMHGRRRGEYSRCLGLSLEHLDDDSRAALAELLSARVPSPPGARHERRARAREPRGARVSRTMKLGRARLVTTHAATLLRR